MNKDKVIKSLQVGLSEAIDIIKYLKPSDPMIKHAIEQLDRLLAYSEYVYDDSKGNHPLYDN